MKTLHCISFNSCFVSIQVVVRFMHEKRVSCVARAQQQVVHSQL